MKKSLLSIFAMATMLLATGCSQDDEFVNGGENGELVEVSFNLKSSEGPQSRAISDGKKAKELFYGAFDQNGNVIPTQHGKTTMEDPIVGTTVTFKLVKGQTYDFVFWAQTPGNKYYNVNPENLTEISVNYNTDANDENRDAFFGKELDYTVEGRFTKTVKLTRPFGQLNVGTTIEDYNTATTLLSGKKVNKSKLVVKNLPNTLNLLTGELGESVTAEAVFNLATLPTDVGNDYEILAVDINKDEEIAENEKYVHLSMNYLLAAEEESAIHEVDITFANGDTDADIINTINVPNAPIQRNYRTNILGQILTTEGDFTIYVDPAYVDDHNYFLSEYTVASTAELLEVLKTLNAENYTGPTNVTINLAADVEWETGDGHGSTPLLTATSKVQSLTIDGKGQYSFTATGAGVGPIRAANGATLVFKDLKIMDNSNSYAEGSWELGYLEMAGSLRFINVNIVNAIMICGGSENNSTAGDAEFIGCTFNSNQDKEYAVWVSGLKATFTDCTFSGLRGIKIHECYGSVVESVTIDGNTFIGLTKPGVVIGDIVKPGETGTYGEATWTKPADLPVTTISITNNVFENCGAGDTTCPSYVDGIYESDTDVTTFNFVMEGNSVGDDDGLAISSAAGLKHFAESVNKGNSYKDQTIKLTADIDLDNELWTPIGACNTPAYFQGTFDGQGHTIYNLNVDKSTDTYGNSSAGLFGWIDAAMATIKNVKVDGATVKGSHWVGVIVGYMTGRIENCSVTNAVVEGVNVNDDANGDKVGGIVGCLNEDSYINSNTVTNSTITGNRDIGGIAGSVAASTHEMTSNKVTDVVLTYYTKKNYASAGEIVSERTGYVADTSNTFANVTIIHNLGGGTSTDGEGNYFVAASENADFNAVNDVLSSLKEGETLYLSGDVKGESATTAPYGNKYALKQDGGIIDGNGHELQMDCYGDDYGIMTSGGTIKNLTIKEGCRAVMIMYPTQNIILNNVNIGGDGVLYPINTGEAGSEDVDLIVTNSTLAGWTSFSNIASASFTNVEFKQGTYYNNIYGRVIKPYVNTTFTDCTFIEHMNLDLSGLTNGQKVTFTNCKVSGQAVKADVFTIPSTDEEYDTKLFTVDLPSWATSINDCVIFN